MSKILYVFTQEDKNAIELAKQRSAATGTKAWDEPCLSEFKRRLKDYLRNELDEQCCYCSKSTNDEFNMVLDIEHILPKSAYPDFEFEAFNLSVSCKRCNMEIKKEDISFVVNHQLDAPSAKLLDNYLLIHPNLDDYSSHLGLLTFILGQNKLIKYLIVNDSEKGKYTYRYFKLMLIEINSLNKVQGITHHAAPLSKLIPEQLALQIKELLDIENPVI